jgi:uncharacterized tellurite resistance protein B-like protein
MAEFEGRYRTFLEKIAEKMDRDMDEEKRKKLIREAKDGFEEKLNRELIKQYNELLGMSLSANINDFKPKIESSRLEKARKMLANL